MDPPGNPNLGEYWVAGMVKVSEPVIKIVISNKRKWLIRLNQRVLEDGRVLSFWALVTNAPPGRQQAPNPAYF
jgi:hypothetical protein